MQRTLPFPHLQIPDEHVELLRLANAGAFPDKRFFFYPFKGRFLKAHALPAGYDLQTIAQPCWCGDGIYRGIEDTLPEHRWTTCFRCQGTRIYDTKKVVLQRWLLQDHVFHTVTDLPPHRLSFVSTISGLVQHEPVAPKVAASAYLRLLWHYDRDAWLEALERPFRRWFYHHWSLLHWKLTHYLRNLRRSLLQDSAQADDLPF